MPYFASVKEKEQESQGRGFTGPPLRGKPRALPFTKHSYQCTLQPQEGGVLSCWSDLLSHTILSTNGKDAPDAFCFSIDGETEATSALIF